MILFKKKKKAMVVLGCLKEALNSLFMQDRSFQMPVSIIPAACCSKEPWTPSMRPHL